MDTGKAKELLQRYQAGNISQSEKELVESWYRQLIDTGEWQWAEGEKEKVETMLESRIIEKIKDTQKQKAARVYSLNRKYWWAAASIVLLLGFVSYFLVFNKPTKSTLTVATKVTNDVAAPQSSKAMITLANGQRVFLDSIANGALEVQGNVKLIKLASGEIVYQSSGRAGGEMQYNTLDNPRGSKVINMVLTDGSKVWLNAGSSLTYPVLFVGNKRKVSIEGEAYFEVAHDEAKPFVAHYDAIDVQVLGTHFNVNTFEDDDRNVKVTLIEGSVRVDNGNATNLLKPGQQALINDKIKIVSDADLNQVMAWKNGYFQFDKASLQSVLKQVARWYDVDVIYQGENQPRQFVGEMEKDLSLSEVLKILEINKVHFTIKGNNLIINPD
ncbi:MAG: FecR domain-containing protein [Ginsengibacter sp.]